MPFVAFTTDVVSDRDGSSILGTKTLYKLVPSPPTIDANEYWRTALGTNPEPVDISVNFDASDYLPNLKAYLLQHGTPPPPFTAPGGDPAVPSSGSPPLTSFACLQVSGDALKKISWSENSEQHHLKVEIRAKPIPTRRGRYADCLQHCETDRPCDGINTTLRDTCNGVALFHTEEGWVLYEGEMDWGLRVERESANVNSFWRGLKEARDAESSKFETMMIQFEIPESDGVGHLGGCSDPFMPNVDEVSQNPPGMAEHIGGPVCQHLSAQGRLDRSLTSKNGLRQGLMLLGHSDRPLRSHVLRWPVSTPEGLADLSFSDSVWVLRKIDSRVQSYRRAPGEQPKSSAMISCSLPAELLKTCE